MVMGSSGSDESLLFITVTVLLLLLLGIPTPIVQLLLLLLASIIIAILITITLIDSHGAMAHVGGIAAVIAGGAGAFVGRFGGTLSCVGS